MSDPLLLRPAEVAELLGMSRSRVYELARAGDLAGVVRLGGSVRVHRPTLERWLGEQAGVNRTAGPSRPTAPEVRDVAARPPTTA